MIPPGVAVMVANYCGANKNDEDCANSVIVPVKKSFCHGMFTKARLNCVRSNLMRPYFR